MAASSSDIRQIYDVFISFRGEDTRNGFTGHLYAALCRRKLNAYIDEDGLEKGNEISSALLKAIEESKISVVIFSKNYASSSWCLSELAHILHCKKVKNQLVIPIFYHVHPSDIRKQRDSYGDAFDVHEKRFDGEKVQLWRQALEETADMCGWHISVTSSEAKVVEQIVGDILKKLNIIMPSKDDFKDLVGIHKRAQEIERLLHFSSQDVHIIGIWGMGGIGKTTLARVIFSHFAPQFESCCFLENIKSKQHKLQKLKKKLFSKLLEEEIENVNQFLMNRLQRTKVLIVLDDVDDVDQLDCLAKDRSWFGQGSRIIITTRDRQLLYNIKSDGVYEVDELNFGEALQLFYAKAFQGAPPSPGYEAISKKVVTKYAKGVPLALKVLGCHLCSRSKEEWESELKKLENIPNEKVQNMLRISYEGLSDNEKNIFLDIAVFFAGVDQDVAKTILNSYCSGVAIGIRILIDKSLITIDHSNKFSMHDLVRDMGIEIVRQQSPNEPGKRSRLCSAEDVCNVLKKNTGTEKIQGMAVDMGEIRAAICLRPNVFKRMVDLKFLIFRGPCVEGKLLFPEGLKHLPDELRYLHWDDFPLPTLPQKFWPQNLVQLHLCYSSIRKLWDGIQHIVSLEVLDLRGCKNLTEIPDLSLAQNLETINLFGCFEITKFPELPTSVRHLYMSYTGIENVPPSIKCLSRLLSFDLRYCRRLKSLPANLFKLESLQELDLEGCRRSEYLPEVLEPTEHQTVFEIQNAAIRHLSLSIQNLVNCTYLDLRDPGVTEIPDLLFYLPALSILYLSGTNIIRIPESIKLSKLKRLWIHDCKLLQSLPELPVSIEIVYAVGCTALEMVSNSWSLLSKGRKMKLGIWEDFAFDGCLQLDHKNIITEFRIRSLLNASAFELSRNKGVETTYSPIGISYTGDEIPEWFSYQNKGCLINLKLPPLWYSPNNFMGFAFCIVVKDVGWLLNWEIHLKTNCNYGMHFQFPLRHCLRSDNRNRIIMASYVDTGTDDFYPATEMSFHFSVNHLFDKIKRCGVRMLCLQDAFEFGTISDLHVFGKSSVVPNELQPSGFWKNVLLPLLGFQPFPSRQQLCEKILCSKMQQRHKNLWLLLVWDVLPVREVLNRQMDVSDTSCPLCGTALESATHLFLCCESVRPLWFMSPWGLRTDFLRCDSMASFLEVVLCGDPNSDVYHFDREFLHYASVLVDAIWLARNELIHKGKVFCIADIHSSVRAQFDHSSQLEPHPKRLKVSH